MSITTATEKLKKEYEKVKDREYEMSKPILEYLMKHVSESEAFAEDVDQEHKTWDKCEKYITEKARKLLNGKSGAVKREVVYEWAEDYYHLDDKAQAEKEAREKAASEARKKALAEKKPAPAKKAEIKNTKSDEKPQKTDEKPQNNTENTQNMTESAQKKPKEKQTMDGQMDFFSMFGDM